MRHCSSPATCSVCLGLPARRVTVAGGETLVDGRPVDTSRRFAARKAAGLRGARATAMRTGVQRRGPR